jgi:site-specific DNA-cytosine methylase
VDSDPAGLRDFGRLAGVPGTRIDLFSREQYTAFHGKEPPAGWVEALPDDIRNAAGLEHPHIVFLSAPCKGFSGLLAEKQSKTAKYQALNGLTLRGVWLALEAFKDDPVEFFIFENVPRIMTRGRPLLDAIVALFRAYGYAVAETTHDCGELGELGQSRKRFLLVARHTAKVPPFLYEPAKKRLRGVGEILEKLPLPGLVDAAGIPLGGPMHRMPALQWKTWVRLAFVEAGSDWRSLNKLTVGADGMLRDYGIVPDGEWFNGAYGVNRWSDTAGVVTSKNQPSSGASAVADPRIADRDHADTIGVRPWERHTGAIGGQSYPSNGAYSVADPRWPDSTFGGLSVNEWKETAGAITTQRSPGSSAQSVADPRIEGRTPFNHAFRLVRFDETNPAVHSAGGNVADPRPIDKPNYKTTKYRVTDWVNKEASGAVIAASTTGNGAFAVADPRPEAFKGGRRHYEGGGHYGVLPWDGKSGAVAASAQLDNGRWSVADPRVDETIPCPACGNPMESKPGDQGMWWCDFCNTLTPLDTLVREGWVKLPGADERLVCCIRALDGTWHRPLTTLELASLQSLVDPEEFLELDGLSDSAWRERIGNAVPPASAAAIASVMGRALLQAWTGETFVLSTEPIWVQPIALALAVDTGAAA